MAGLPDGWSTAGDERLLDAPLLGLVSSVECPGSVIVQLLDAMRAIRSAGITVVGGFHSPVERECLELLLAGTQPIVLAQARRTSRLVSPLRAALDSGRLVNLSPTKPTGPRVTKSLAVARNEVVARLASALFVPYAAPGSATEALALNALRSGKPVLVLSGSSEARVAVGARTVSPTGIPQTFSDITRAR